VAEAIALDGWHRHRLSRRGRDGPHPETGGFMTKSVQGRRTKSVRRVSRSPRDPGLTARETRAPRRAPGLGARRRTVALIALGTGVTIAALCQRLLRERRRRSLLSRLAAAVTATVFDRRR
jgi:hypothetical protein